MPVLLLLRHGNEDRGVCVGYTDFHLGLMPVGENMKDQASTALEYYNVRPKEGAKLLQATIVGCQQGLVSDNSVFMHIYNAL